jgi:hypothetical protein
MARYQPRCVTDIYHSVDWSPNKSGDRWGESKKESPMRVLMALVLTGALAGALTVSVADPASAAKVVTKYGTYEGGCSGSSCLYKARKAPKKAQMHHKSS